MTVNVRASDVIRIILQFLRENGLQGAQRALQDECSVSLNTLEDPQGLADAIAAGHWDRVLVDVNGLKLAAATVASLYELIAVEMLACGEADLAHAIIRTSPPIQRMRQEDTERFLKLESCYVATVAAAAATASQQGGPHLASAGGGGGGTQSLPQAGLAEAYFGTPHRRAAVANEILASVHVVPPSRLVTLIGDALRAYAQQGAIPPHGTYDLLHGVIPDTALSRSGGGAHEPEEVIDEVCSEKFAERLFPAGSHVECVAFSPRGRYFALGLADGFIEIVSQVSGERRTEGSFSYQASLATMMVMTSAVICASFSANEDFLLVGTHGGDAAIWRVASGTCVMRFPGAHQGGVTAISISPDGQRVVTAGYDGAIRLWGTRSGRILREVKEHSSFVTDCFYAAQRSPFATMGGGGVAEGSPAMYSSITPRRNMIYSCGADGLFCIIDDRTGSSEGCRRFAPLSGQAVAAPAILTVVPRRRDASTAIVLSKCNKAVLFDHSALPSAGSGGQGPPHCKGTIQHTYNTMPGDSTVAAKPSEAATVVGGCASPSGRLLYIAHASGRVLCIDTTSDAIAGSFSAPQGGELIGIAAHPSVSEIVTFDVDGRLCLWKPPTIPASHGF